MNIPILHTPRLILRGFTPEDLEPLHAIVSHPRVLAYLPRSEPWPLETVRVWMASQAEHWSEHGFGWFALEHRPGGQLIGWCGLRMLHETREVEVLYLLDEPYWGRGLATEAAKRCVEDGFRVYGLDLIIGLTHPDNRASQRVLEKAGLSFTNRARYFGVDCLRYAADRTSFGRT